MSNYFYTIRKPVYFALQFLNQLGEELIAKNEQLIVTKEIGKEVYHIIGFHYQWYNSRYSVEQESVSSPEKIKEIFTDAQELCVNLILKNLDTDGRYTITSNRICQEKGSILDEWKKFQYEETITNADMKYLREITQPERRMEKAVSTDKTLKISMTLSPQEIVLLHVSKDEE